MTRKVKAVLLSVFALAMSSSAQFTQSNARIGSMADIFIIDDISNVYRYAAIMNQYKNDIQVTFSTPMLGIKSFGENFTAGAYVRNSLMLDQSNTVTNFYTLGRTTVNNVTRAAPEIDSELTYIPHVLLGMRVSGINIGLDVFYEWARTSFNDEYKTATSTVTTKESAKLSNPGVIGSVGIDAGNVPVLIKAGIGFPKIKGESTIEATGAETQKTESKSDRGMFFEAGGEVGLTVLGGTFTPGIDFIGESYAFKTNNNEPTNKFKNTRYAIYAGFEKQAFSSGLWSAMYQMKVFSSKNDATANDSAIDRRLRTLQQTLSAGAENGWDSVWIFDKVFARGGAGLNITTPLRSEVSDTADLHARSQTKVNAFPTIGIGIAKGIFEPTFLTLFHPDL